MKISCWYPENLTAAWSCTIGVADELERMGHEVVRVALRPAPSRNKIPTLDELHEFDLILLCGMEHFIGLIKGAFGEAWKKVPVRKAAWYHESAFREDRNPITADMFPWAEEHFFPAAQDAEFFDQEHFIEKRAHWLPFGVDTEMFRYRSDWPEGPAVATDGTSVFDGMGAPKTKKIYDCAFIGGLYPKRQAFLQQLARHLDEKTALDCGNVVMQDLSGTLMDSQTKLYAENLRQIKVFVNLPTLSQLQVTKVFEVLAVGTFILTPALEGAGAANNKMFQSGKHLMYYPESRPDYLAKLMKEWTAPENEKKRGRTALQGYEEIREKHTLRHRLNELFLTLKIGKASEPEKVEVT